MATGISSAYPISVDHFVYSLLPHEGNWNEFTVSQAYALNDPLIVWANKRRIPNPALRAMPTSSLIKVDRPNVVIETVKHAEDGQGLIVRLYESQRRRDEFTLTTGFPLRGAWRTSLLEENQKGLDVGERQVCLFIKPYQIMTLRLLPD